MSQDTKKTGISMSRIENTNTIKSLKCDCRKCFHSSIRDGALICNYYNKVKPTKRVCKRFIVEKPVEQQFIVVNSKGHRLRDFAKQADAIAYAAQINGKITNKEDAVHVIPGKKAIKRIQNQRKRRAKNGPSEKLDTP